ncbi:MAG: glycosyltransferase family 4 protein [Nitrososphaeria archaeon]
MKSIKVLMVLPHFEHDLFAGNYRRIFEFITRCYKYNIDYSTIEFVPLSIRIALIKKVLGYNLCSYPIYLSKGFGSKYDENRIVFLILNIFSIIRTVMNIRREQPFHIVMVPDALPSWVIFGFIVSRILRRPLCITVQLVPQWLIESEGSNYRSLQKHFRKKYSLLSSIFYAILALMYLKILGNSYLIFVSESSQREFITKVKVCKKTFVNYNGITVHEKFRKSENIPYDACFVGFHDERKGIFDLINAWNFVVKEKPNAKLITCGGIAPETKRIISEMLSEFKLNNNIILKGIVDEETKHQILSASKIFVFPSKHESQSIAVGEALGMGLPVVAYDIPALRDSYGECRAVFLCKKDDLNELARRILELLEKNWLEFSSLSQVAKSFIQQKYTWEATMNKERNIYISIIANWYRKKGYHENPSP